MAGVNAARRPEKPQPARRDPSTKALPTLVLPGGLVRIPTLSSEGGVRLIQLIMDWLTNLIWHDGKFLGIEWHLWKVVGWTGNVLFTSRFFVQWWATEKQRQVVVPSAFWWLSLAGSGCLLVYGFYQRDSVFIFAYLFTWIPYIRNLMIGGRFKKGLADCPVCASKCPAGANYCPACGVKRNEAVAGS